MPPTRRSTTRAAPTSAARESTKPYSRTNTRRSGSPSSNPTPPATLSRTPPPGGKNSLKLTVKAAPSKLRQAISRSQLPPNPYTDEASESDATPKPSARTARATRNPRTVVEQDSDEDDEDEDEDAEGEDDDDDEDAEGEEVDQELLANEDSQDDAEGEDDDMDDLPDSHPPPPVLKQQKIPGKSKANVSVSAPAAGPLKSVEAKEMEDADDDELSDLESGDEMEPGEGDEEEDIGEDDDDLSGSDIDGSRSATPDPSKLTRRQRGVFEEENVGLLALSNEAQKKKLLSVEEHAMRRQEMARRRKNLSEKRNEEEKVRSRCRLIFMAFH
jgi:Ino eighty subunit 2